MENRFVIHWNAFLCAGDDDGVSKRQIKHKIICENLINSFRRARIKKTAIDSFCGGKSM